MFNFVKAAIKEDVEAGTGGRLRHYTSSRKRARSTLPAILRGSSGRQ